LRKTIYDIARAARVGIGTVSRVFNDHPRVAEETKRRVLKVARRLNYSPHPHARRLAKQKSFTVVAVVPSFSSYFFVEILQALHDGLRHYDYDLLLSGLDYPQQTHLSLARVLDEQRADGALVLSLPIMRDLRNVLEAAKIPLVLVDTYDPAFNSVSSDNVHGAFLATQHLTKLGHKRIGMIAANTSSPPARDRLKGFKKALAEHKINLRPEWVKISRSHKLDGFTYEAGYQLMQAFMEMNSRRRPTAYFVSSDVQVVGALRAIEEAGLRCPEDIAIFGYDDIVPAEHYGISTIRQQIGEMGKSAVALLMERVTNGESKVVHRRYEPQLVIRRTCGTTQGSRSASNGSFE